MENTKEKHILHKEYSLDWQGMAYRYHFQNPATLPANSLRKKQQVPSRHHCMH